MTEKNMRGMVANYLKPYIGIKEGSTKHKEILKIFNNSKLCTRYTMTTKDAWCATTVSAVFIALGFAGKQGSGKLFECVECSCNNMISLAKKQGIWQEKDSYVPKQGDIIMYDWQDSGNGDNTGHPDHVGIVYSVSDGIIKVIEGNKNDSVGYRSIKVNGRYIRGFITPNYAKFADKETPKKETTKQDSKTPTERLVADSKTTFKVSKTNSPSRAIKYDSTVTASELNVRDWAGVENKKCSFSPLHKGDKVGVCDAILTKDKNTWYYIKHNGKYGFVSSKYIK